MVDAEKVRRLTQAAEAWLGRHPESAGLEISIEAVALRGRRLQRVPVMP